jgi:hypothetical protein
MARGRVDHETSRLVHDQEGLVLVDDLQGDVFRVGFQWFRRRDLHFQDLAHLKSIGFFRRLSVYRDPPILDQGDDPGA